MINGGIRIQDGVLYWYRPMSAQNYSTMIDHEIYLSKRPKKKKPLYQRQPYVIRCQAYKNGNRDVYTQVAASNVKQVPCLDLP